MIDKDFKDIIVKIKNEILPLIVAKLPTEEELNLHIIEYDKEVNKDV